MNIGIDIDDTIANTHDVLFTYADRYTVEELNKKIVIKKVREENGNGTCAKTHGWTHDEEEYFWDNYYGKVISEVPVKMYASEVIKLWKNRGHKISIITARFERKNFDVKAITENWLKENGIEYDEIIYNASNKVQAVKENNIDIFIDDAIQNCKVVSEAGIKTYLMDSIENVGFEIPNVERLYSWIHAIQEIQ